ncbi:type I-E CRISPR-associated protein Cas5/CasD [Blastococcus capsensis]|uniref:type I-E CRISPR-associated protein Cas5/CasD n=1 Tax=Blastococcus capsensis TaxID=1564163 RepID=UPI002540900D|nr:type I-E CRISPR-associated protein Cas5/CasD [Blastococcus capsensis]MDK3256658.1 type I-E CRISPR-associated protein Cas5/CasD [Blastococcus capsensis]
MTVLLLTLTGPLQSWGSASRFVRRGTEPAPTKSGVVGLLAAAQGRRRADPVEDLAALRFGVRIDQPGRLVRDFQTERRADGTSLPLSYRFYLADAVFLAGLEGDATFLEGLADAIRRPVFPLFLGRRSCPPAGPLLPLVLDGTLEEVFRDRPWAAAAWYRRSREVRNLPEVRLETAVDAQPADVGAVSVRDHPVSFDPELRQYGWRSVAHGAVTVPGPAAGRAVATARGGGSGTHDPMAVFDR